MNVKILCFHSYFILNISLINIKIILININKNILINIKILIFLIFHS